MARLTALIALCVSLSACGGTDEESEHRQVQISPGASVFSLIGTVIGYDGPVVGALGDDHGRHQCQPNTDDQRRWEFRLRGSGAVRLYAASCGDTNEGYLPQNQAVNLAANQSVTFYLSDH